MRCRSITAAVVLSVALAACGGDAEKPAVSSAPPVDGGSVDAGATTQPATPTTLDQSPFCVAVRDLEALGSDTENPTPEQILAETEAFLDVLGEAQVNVPEDAPPDVEGLIDDYRAIAEAIGAAGGDRDAAYAALEADQPDLFARLSDPDAHADAFLFFADRCGTDLP